MKIHIKRAIRLNAFVPESRLSLRSSSFINNFLRKSATRSIEKPKILTKLVFKSFKIYNLTDYETT